MKRLQLFELLTVKISYALIVALRRREEGSDRFSRCSFSAFFVKKSFVFSLTAWSSIKINHGVYVMCCKFLWFTDAEMNNKFIDIFGIWTWRSTLWTSSWQKFKPCFLMHLPENFYYLDWDLGCANRVYLDAEISVNKFCNSDSWGR